MFGDDDQQQNNQPAQPVDTPASTGGISQQGDAASEPASISALPSPPSEPAGTNPAADSPADAGTASVKPATAASDPDDLLNIKQQALQQLSPLVSHLDQTPEEKFRTTMMMIQATDDQSLIKDAYAAAQQIPDDKSKAQALLDIVNEINYFTQKRED